MAKSRRSALVGSRAYELEAENARLWDYLEYADGVLRKLEDRLWHGRYPGIGRLEYKHLVDRLEEEFERRVLGDGGYARE